MTKPIFNNANPRATVTSGANNRRDSSTPHNTLGKRCTAMVSSPSCAPMASSDNGIVRLPTIASACTSAPGSIRPSGAAPD